MKFLFVLFWLYSVQTLRPVLMVHLKAQGGNAYHFHPGAIVLTCEVVKFLVARMLSRRRLADLLPLVPSMRLHAVPSLLYLINNRLQYPCLQRIGVPLFTIIGRLNILVTAGLAVAFLRRRLSSMELAAIALLFVGAVVPPATDAQIELTSFSTLVGIGLTLVTAFNSGLNSIFTETALKSTKHNLDFFDATTFMYGYGILWNCLFELFAGDDGSLLWSPSDFFRGFSNPYTIALLSINVLGGLFTGLLVKQSSSIAKTFVQVASMLSASAITIFLYNDMQLTPSLAIGLTFVSIASIMYSMSSSSSEKLRRENMQQLRHQVDDGDDDDDDDDDDDNDALYLQEYALMEKNHFLHFYGDVCLHGGDGLVVPSCIHRHRFHAARAKHHRLHHGHEIDV